MSIDIEKFEQIVLEEIDELNREQTVKFAWLCAVRALPFIGFKGSFDYWKKNERQVHLYSVLNALDISIARSAARSAALSAALSARSAARSALSADAARYALSADDTLSAARYATLSAALSAARSARSARSTLFAARYAARSARYAALSAARYTDSFPPPPITKKLEEIIMHDIEDIKNNRQIQNNSTELYGKVWINFQIALKNEGCEYWGKLYQNIFDNLFEIDIEELEKRLNVLPEIKAQGAAEVAKHLEDIVTYGSEYLNEARLIILGDKGAGKTSLTRKLLNPNSPLPIHEESTPGVDTHLWEIDDVNVHIWDFAGHVVTHAVHKFFLSERCLYIIVHNGRYNDSNPTENIRYWLDHIKHYGGESQVLLLINCHDNHRVSIEINNLKEDYKFIIGKEHQFSIKKDNDELMEFRNLVENSIKNNLSWEKNIVPTNLYKVKEALESIFIKDNDEHAQELITIEEVKDIAQELEVNNHDELCHRLHSLGVCLWYKDLDEYNTLILNPEWASYGVYKIINWLHNLEEYQIKLEEFKTVFTDELKRFPEDKHNLIFKLMKKIEIAYEIKNTKELVVPHVLPKDQPDSLPEFSLDGDLLAKFTSNYKFLPNTISRFIVRHSKELKIRDRNPIFWRKGVVLRDGKGSTALVREKEREITISVKGKDKTNYFNKLVATMNDIFESYKNQKPELSVSVNRFGPIKEQVFYEEPRYQPIENITTAAYKEIPLYDYKTGQVLNLEKILKEYGINIETFTVNNNYGQSFHGREYIYTLNQSKHEINNITTYNSYNIEAQEQLKKLKDSLSDEHEFEAREIENVISALEESPNLEHLDDKKRKSLGYKLKRFLMDLNSEDSELRQTLEGLKVAISIGEPVAKNIGTLIKALIPGFDPSSLF